MDNLSHFHSLEELIRALDRERKLLYALFPILEEVSYIDPLLGKNKRPDIVVYVNGIALAVIELKRSLVNYEEGIKQHLSNERDFIPSFFTTTQFTIASNDDVEFRYGTIGTPLAFWCKWKRDTNKVGDTITEKEAYRLFFKIEKSCRFGMIWLVIWRVRRMRA